MLSRTRKAETLAAPGGEALDGMVGWGAAVIAGALAGLVFVAIEMLLAWLALGPAPGMRLRMTLAGVLADQGAPSAAAIILVSLVPIVLAAGYGVLVALATH
jgi:hypothetical protein